MSGERGDGDGDDAEDLALDDHPRQTMVQQAADLWARAERARVGVVPSESYIDDQRQGFVENMSRPDAWITVAHGGGLVLGCVAGFPPAGCSSAATQLLAYLAVDPPAWGRGIGRRLVARAEERSREAGAGHLRLTVHARNVRALRLYEGRGWRPTGWSERTPFDDEPLIELQQVL